MRKTVYRDFLRDLHSILIAGVPVRQALENLAASSFHRLGYQPFAERLLEKIANGSSLAEALASAPDEISAVDVALVRAGEGGGKLPEILASLVRRVEAGIELRQSLRLRMSYVLVVMVLAVVLMPLSLVVSGDGGTYLLIQIGFFLPVVLLVWLVRRGPQLFSESAGWRDAYEKFVFGIPWWGTQQVQLALAHVFEVVGLLLEAGVSFHDGIPLAAEATSWPRLRRSMLAVGTDIESGKSVADALAPLEKFVKGSWRERLASAEYAGKLDQGFLDVARNWEVTFYRNVQQLARLLPIAVYLLVGAMVFFWALGALERIYAPLGVV